MTEITNYDESAKALVSMAQVASGFAQSATEKYNELVPQVNDELAQQQRRKWVSDNSAKINQAFTIPRKEDNNKFAALTLLMADDVQRDKATQASYSREWLKQATGVDDPTGRLYFGASASDEENYKRIQAAINPEKFKSPLPTALQAFDEMPEEEQFQSLKKWRPLVQKPVSVEPYSVYDPNMKSATRPLTDEEILASKEQYRKELQSKDHTVQLRALTGMMEPASIDYSNQVMASGLWDDEIFSAFDRSQQRLVSQYLQLNREKISPNFFLQEAPSRIKASGKEFIGNMGGFASDARDAGLIGYAQYFEALGFSSAGTAAGAYDEIEKAKQTKFFAEMAQAPKYESSGFAGDTFLGAVESAPFTATLFIPYVGMPLAIASQAKQGRDEAVYLYDADPDRAYAMSTMAATASVVSEKFVAGRVFKGQGSALSALGNKQYKDAFTKAITSVVQGTGENTIQEAFQSWIEIAGRQVAIGGIEDFDPQAATEEVARMLPHLAGVSFWMTLGVGGAGAVAEYSGGKRQAGPMIEEINKARVIEYTHEKNKEEFLNKQERDSDWWNALVIEYNTASTEAAKKAVVEQAGIKNIKEFKTLFQGEMELRTETSRLEFLAQQQENEQLAEEDRQDEGDLGAAPISTSDVTFNVRKIQETFQASGAAAPLRWVDTVEELPESVKNATANAEDIEGYYDEQAGEVVLVTENLRSPEHALQVWAEEQVGHFANTQQGLGDFNNLIQGSGVTVEDMRASLGEQYASIDDSLVVDEYVAKIARSQIDGQTLTVKEQSVWEKIKEWFVQTFGLSTAGPKEALDRAIAELIRARTKKALQGSQKTGSLNQNGLGSVVQDDLTTELSGITGQLPDIETVEGGIPADGADVIDLNLGAMQESPSFVPEVTETANVEPEADDRPVSTLADLGNFPIQRILTALVKADPSRLQFKLNIDADGVQKALEGIWNELAAGNLLLWESLDGTLFVANGHHRLALAKIQGVEFINAQILKESEGYTIDDAYSFAAEANILDGKGTVYDHAEYFRREKERDPSRIAGAREKGIERNGFRIGTQAQDSLYSAFLNQQITENQTLAIIQGAGDNASAQNAAMGRLMSGKGKMDNTTLSMLAGKIKRDLESGKIEVEESEDLFGGTEFAPDDAAGAAENYYEDLAKSQGKIIKEINERLSSIKGTLASDKRIESAKKQGVNVTNKAKAKKNKEGLQLAQNLLKMTGSRIGNMLDSLGEKVMAKEITVEEAADQIIQESGVLAGDLKLKFSLAKPLTEDQKKAFESAKKNMGVTKDIREAGYVLPDGKMLDFSGKRDGGEAGVRYMDHREVEFDGLEKSEYSDAMFQFMNLGAMRVDHAAGMVNFHIPISSAQKTIALRILENGGYVEAERNGKPEDSYFREAENRKEAQRALNEAIRFLDGDDSVKNIRFSLAQTPKEDLKIKTEMANIEAKAKADGTWLKAPNGEDTNLNPFQWKQVRTTAFKKWFGDWENDAANASKVVDGNGEPMVLFHGTGDSFTVFEKRKANDAEGRSRGLGLGKGKFYLTGSDWAASNFASNAQERNLGKSPNVMPVFVSAENIITEEAYQERFNKLAGEQIYSSSLGRSTRDRFIARLDKEMNAEGVGAIVKVYRNKQGEIAEYSQVAVYDGAQIKSATGNQGTFDAGNNDIRFSLRQESSPARNAAIVAARQIYDGWNVTLEDIQRLGNFKPEEVALILKDAKMIVDFTDLELKGIGDSAIINRRLRKAERAIYRNRMNAAFKAGTRRGEMVEKARANLANARRKERAANLSSRTGVDDETAEVLHLGGRDFIRPSKARAVPENRSAQEDEGAEDQPKQPTEFEITKDKYKDGAPKSGLTPQEYLQAVKGEVRAAMVGKGDLKETATIDEAMDTPEGKEDYRKTIRKILDLALDEIPFSQDSDRVKGIADQIAESKQIGKIDRLFLQALSIANGKRVKEDKGTLLKGLRKALKPFTRAPKSREEAKARKASYDAHKLLHYANKVMKMTGEELETELDNLNRAVNNFGKEGSNERETAVIRDAGADAMQKLVIANMFGGLKGELSTPADVARAIAWAEKVIATGKAEVEEIARLRQERLDVQVTDLESAISEAKEKIKFMPKDGFFSGLSTTPMFINQRFEDLVRYGKSATADKVRDNLESLSEDINQATREAEKGTLRGMESLGEAMQTIYGKKSSKALDELVFEREEYAKFSADGTTPLGKSFLIQLVGVLEQKHYRKMAETNDYLKARLAQLDEIRAQLSDQDKQLLEFFRDYYFDKRGEISAVLKKITGMDIQNTEMNYIPFKADARDSGPDSVHYGVEFIPSFSEARVSHNRQMDESKGILELFLERNQEQNNFIAFGELKLELRGLLTRDTTKKLIRQTYGKSYGDQFYTHLTNVMVGRPQSDSSDAGINKFLNKFRAWMAYSRMGFSLTSFSRQGLGVFNVAAELTTTDLLKVIPRAFTPQGVSDMFKVYGSENMRTRLQRGYNEAVYNALQVANEGGFKQLKQFARLAMRVPQQGDAFASAIMGGAVYRSYLNQYAKQGFSEAEADRKAMNKVFGLIDRTQQSSHMKDMATWLRSSNSFIKGAAQFTSAISQQAAYEATALRAWSANKSKRNTERLVRVLLVNHLIIPASQFAVKEIFQFLFDDEDEGVDWEQMLVYIIAGPASGIILVGALVELLASVVVNGKPNPFLGGTPLDGPFQDIELISLAIRDIATGEQDDILAEMNDILSRMFPAYKQARIIATEE